MAASEAAEASAGSCLQAFDRGSRVGPQAASQVLQSAICKCKANCGQGDCKFNKNAHHRKASLPSQASFCNRLAAKDSQYCVFCKCENEKCTKPRQLCHGVGRWCSSCGRVAGKLPAQKYRTRFGVFGFEQQWPRAVKMAARYAFAASLAPPPRLWHGIGFATSSCADKELNASVASPSLAIGRFSPSWGLGGGPSLWSLPLTFWAAAGQVT